MDLHITLEEFSQITQIPQEEVDEQDLIADLIPKALTPKKALEIFLRRLENVLMAKNINSAILDPIFLEQSIAALSTLYERILQTTQDNTQNIHEENNLLKDTIYSLQEQCQIYENQVQDLESQLLQKDEEIAFLQRKHKLMWGRLSNSSIGAK